MDFDLSGLSSTQTGQTHDLCYGQVVPSKQEGGETRKHGSCPPPVFFVTNTQREGKMCQDLSWTGNPMRDSVSKLGSFGSREVLRVLRGRARPIETEGPSFYLIISLSWFLCIIHPR